MKLKINFIKVNHPPFFTIFFNLKQQDSMNGVNHRPPEGGGMPRRLKAV